MSTTTIDPRDRGCDRAFERLYRRYARDVYRFVLAVVRNPQEAEDVTQTAFLNAYRAYARGDRPEKPHSWLIAIAHNAIRSRRRWTVRRPREVALDDALLQVVAAPADRSDVADVLQALGELPVNQREALAMRELEGRSYPEIAETLGVTVPAVESLIHRARKTLRARRTSLQGLTAVQLPRSLRTWLEHGDPSGAGLTAKAAVVVAAATVVAGGIGVGSKVAGASEREHRAPARVEPRRHAPVAPAPAARVVAAVPQHPASARRPVAGQRTPAPPGAAPPHAPAPSVPPDPPPLAVAPAADPPARETPPAAAPTAAPAAPTATTTAAAVATTPAVTIDPPALPQLPAGPPLPDLPPVALPSVTVPPIP